MEEITRKLISDSVNARIFYSPENSLIIIELKDIDMIDEMSYKRNALALLDFIREKNIKKLIFNTLKLKTIFTIHLQKWIAKNINQHLLKIMDKVAIIEPEDPITHLSLQLYVEESNKFGPQAQERFFTNEKDALEWLLEKD